MLSSLPSPAKPPTTLLTQSPDAITPVQGPAQGCEDCRSKDQKPQLSSTPLIPVVHTVPRGSLLAQNYSHGFP